MARILPGAGDVKRLATSPRSQAKSNPIPTIVTLATAIIAVQGVKAVAAGQPIDFNGPALAMDGALVLGFVLAAAVIPSDLVIAILLVVLIYDVVVDPGLFASVARTAISKINLGGG
jgi:hypothetical protein